MFCFKGASLVYALSIFRELDGRIAVEDEKIKAVHDDLAAEKEQIRTENIAIDTREFHLQQQVVSECG